MHTREIQQGPIKDPNALTGDQIARAWRDSEYLGSLTDEQRARIPANPAGEIDLDIVNREGQRRELIAGTTAASCSTIAASCSTIAASCSTIATSCSTISGNCSTVAATCSTISSKCSTIAARCSTIAAKCSTVASTCSTIAASCSTIAANCGARRRRRK
jgi:mersacidin/lichenicidin family type 2 lantibiotic